MTSSEERAWEKVSDLEDQIANIKANCDLAIEGRDIKIKELEQENAELKRDKKYKDQLAQAKEIIKDLLRLPYANDWEVYGNVTSYLDKAEQFLNEVEKC